MSAREFLFLEKINQIAVVGPYFKNVVPPFQVMATDVKGNHNSKEFLIVDFIITLRRLLGLGVIQHWMPAI